jgi:hypothetical protein
MPIEDDILKALLEEAEGDSETETSSTESENLAKVRDWGKGWEKKAKELAKEVAPLREFKANAESEQRVGTAKSVFKELELPDEQVDLFLKVHEGDVTPEAIKKFVVDFRLKDLGEGAIREEKDFEPGAGGDAPSSKTYTREEFDALLYTDPARAERLFREGKVDMKRKAP